MVLIAAALAGGGIVVSVVWALMYRYTALGDSLAAGVGSLTFSGYVPRFAFMLMRRYRRLVWMRNLGRFGMTSLDLLEALRTNRHFIGAVRGANLITVNIGGNDLLGCAYQEDCLELAVLQFRQNWEAILAELRRLNPAATILTMTLYNPVPVGDVRRPPIDSYIDRVNQVITMPGLLRAYRIKAVAPVHSAFMGRECELTWYCRIGDIHPTDEGHQVMAQQLDAVNQPEVDTKLIQQDG